VHDIGEQPSNQVLFNELAKCDPAIAAALQAEPSPDEPLPHGGVVMYCTAWCPDCKRARAWLRSHNIPYTEVDIDANPKAAAQVRQWANGNQTTPTFDIDGRIVVDFNEDQLRELLKIR